MRRLTVIFSLICMLFTATAARADKRVAFVVGNGAYKNVAQLPNPPIDAKAMAAVLRNVGFDVVEGTNLTRDTMTERLLEFGKKAQGADVAVSAACRQRYSTQTSLPCRLEALAAMSASWAAAQHSAPLSVRAARRPAWQQALVGSTRSRCRSGPILCKPKVQCTGL